MSGPDVTRLLRLSADGDDGASEDLLQLVYDELRGLAGNLMGRERADHTLQPTALLNEAWMRLMAGETPEAEDRSHFLRLAARTMRRVLVDHARSRGRVKRGEGRTMLSLGEGDAWEEWQNANVDLLDLDEALDRLEANDPELTRVVELRFFAGLTLEETGRALGVTERQVRWSWKLARSWLRRELERGEGADDVSP